MNKLWSHRSLKVGDEVGYGQRFSFDSGYVVHGFSTVAQIGSNYIRLANGKKFNMPIAYNPKADTASWEAMKNFFATLFAK